MLRPTLGSAVLAAMPALSVAFAPPAEPAVTTGGAVVAAPVAGSSAGSLHDPLAVAVGVDGAIWVVDHLGAGRTSVRRLHEGKDTVFLDGLMGAVAILPLDIDRALVLEPPYLHLAIDTDGDGRADRTRPVAGGLGNARSAALLADGTIAVPGSEVRLRWLGDRVEAEASAAVDGGVAAEGPHGELLVADGAIVRSSDLDWLGAVGRRIEAPASVYGMASGGAAPAPITGLTTVGDRVVVADARGRVAALPPRGERWNWSEGRTAEEAWATLTPPRAAALCRDVDGGLLVAARASGATANDATLVRLTPGPAPRPTFGPIDPSGADLLPQLAHADPVRRSTAREAILVRCATGRLPEDDAAVAVRSILRSHRDRDVRREAFDTLARLGRLTADDQAAALADIDPAVRRTAVAEARRRGDRGALQAMVRDSDDDVCVESAMGLLACGRGSLSIDELLAAYRLIAHHRSSEAALASIVAATCGDEVAVLSQLAHRPDAPSAIVAALADSLLTSGVPSLRRTALEIAASPACDPAAATAILGRAAAAARLNDRRPARLVLDAEPRGFAERSRDPALAPIASRIDPQLRWPGRQGVVEEAVPLTEMIDEGRRLFTNCVVCHGAAGLGQPGVYPPLAGSPIAQGDPERFARIVLHGLEGPLTVLGKEYNGIMPRPPLESDEDVAAVMTYVRQAFGNKADPVSPALVRGVREATKGQAGLTQAKDIHGP